jgi:5'-nucleotidase
VRSTPKCWLTDMDGVLVREEHALPGAAEFLDCLVERERPFLVLTSSGTRFVPDACWILADAIELV